MSVFQRNEIPVLLKKVEKGEFSPVYLIFGERYLCREAAEKLTGLLLPGQDRCAGSLQLVDGDKEDYSRTLGLLRTYSMFSARQVILVSDTKLFFSKGVAKTMWEKTCDRMSERELTQAGRYFQRMLDIAGLATADLADENLAACSASRWKELFGFPRPEDDLAWISELIAHLLDNPPDNSPQPAAAGDAAELFTMAFETGIPAANILILMADALDKRKRFYKYIQNNGVVIDLSIDPGGSSVARKDREAVLVGLVKKTLDGFGKKLEPQAMPVLLERVGFHPVAAVMETEKLALYVGDASTITLEDLEVMVGRTREEALYELTEAIAGQRLAQVMLVVSRLLENGIHGLAILATLRNYFNRILLIRSFQEQQDPPYKRGISFPAFQKGYLPKIKAGHQDRPELWKSHPYALYNMFQQAEKYSLLQLQQALGELLAAEYRLKGSALPDRLVLDHLFINLLKPEQKKEADG